MAVLLVIYFGVLVYALATGNSEGGMAVAIISTLFSPGLGAAFHQAAFRTGDFRPGGGITTIVFMGALTYWVYQSDFAISIQDISISGLIWIWAGAALGYNISNKKFGGHED